MDYSPHHYSETHISTDLCVIFPSNFLLLQLFTTILSSINKRI